jgi:hypothetical protein
VIDLARHPELRETIRTGALNRVSCPKCKQPSTITKSLLVDLDGRAPLFFAADPDADEQRSREQLHASIALLKAGGASTSRRILGVAHDVLPLVVSRDIAEDMTAYASGQWTASSIEMQRYGEFLQGFLDDVMAGEVASTAQALLEAPESAAAWWTILEQSPVWQSEQADRYMERLLDVTLAQGTPAQQHGVRQARHLLRRCGAGNPQAVLETYFSSISQAVDPANPLQPPLGAALMIVGGTGEERSAEQQRDILEWSLLKAQHDALELALEPHPGEYVGLDDLFALSLARLLLRPPHGAAEARDAGRLVRPLLAHAQSMPRTWAEAQHLRAVSCLRDDPDDKLAALAQAVEAFRAELTVWTPEEDLASWAEAVGGLARALQALPATRGEEIDELAGRLEEGVRHAQAAGQPEIESRLSAELGRLLMAHRA